MSDADPTLPRAGSDSIATEPGDKGVRTGVTNESLPLQFAFSTVSTVGGFRSFHIVSKAGSIQKRSRVMLG